MEPEQLLPSFSTVTVLFLNKMELGFEEVTKSQTCYKLNRFLYRKDTKISHFFHQVEVTVGMMPSLKELHVCHNCLKNLR